ncbi:72 kDa type IV collagenase-like [Dendronephthya gigantea]|uniref:72 kDa type IV collagenase-like n=1 Tax=Dendronephthya gigantea TaxID=151771 RepID=UPI001069B1AB|nr:72 kDa type IV collagenase-like [Dendronephthya gigantea]
MKYSACTTVANNNVFWCGITTYVIDDVSTWENCATGATCEVKTTSGKCCVFPFYYRGIKYSACTTVANNNVFWCGITTYVVDVSTWENCATGATCEVKTTSGKCCVFPFYYRGIKYSACTTVANNNVFWCGTTTYVIDDVSTWENCASVHEC